MKKSLLLNEKQYKNLKQFIFYSVKYIAKQKFGKPLLKINNDNVKDSYVQVSSK